MRTTTVLAAGALAIGLLVVPTPTGVEAQANCGPGTLYFSEDNNPNGLYTLDVTTGTATLVGTGATGTDSNTIGLTESDDPSVLWGSTWTDFAIINTDGSSANVLDTNFKAEGLGYDPVRKILYGTINGEFFTVDPATGTRTATVLAQPEVDLEGLAVEPATGTVWGIEAGTGFYAYDPDADTWSFIGDTGVEFVAPGLAYDPNADVIYALNGENNGDARLYTIDKATGVATEIGPLGLEHEEGGGLAFVAGACSEPTTTTTTSTTAAPTTTTTVAAQAATAAPRFTG